jgi:hypothetical protein
MNARDDGRGFHRQARKVAQMLKSLAYFSPDSDSETHSLLSSDPPEATETDPLYARILPARTQQCLFTPPEERRTTDILFALAYGGLMAGMLATGISAAWSGNSYGTIAGHIYTSLIQNAGTCH